MTHAEFHHRVENEIGAPAGSIASETRLRDIPRWDSLAVINFMAMVDADFHVNLPVEALDKCDRVSDLEELLGDRIN